MEDELYLKNTIIVKNHEDLIKLLNINKKMKKNNNANYCSIDLNEGHKSFQIIVDKLSTLNLNTTKRIKKNNFILKYKLIQILRLIKNKILFKTDNYTEHKIKIIDQQEIKNFISIIERYRNTIKVKKISKNFFLLTNVES